MRRSENLTEDLEKMSDFRVCKRCSRPRWWHPSTDCGEEDFEASDRWELSRASLEHLVWMAEWRSMLKTLEAAHRVPSGS